LARSLKNQLRLQGNVTFNYAIKSSAGNYHFTGNNAPYNRFHTNDEVEKLEHIVSDTPKTAEIPKLKKLVLIVEENGKPVFELPCTILNSPITLL
jgi:hypothetical protein